MRSALRRVVHATLGQRLLLRPTKRVILLYHDLSTPEDAHFSPHYSTEPDRFSRHLDLLADRFQFVTLDEIVTDPAPSGGKPLAALTFDDGFRTVIERAMPILADRDVPFTLFANGNAVRDDRLDYLPQYQAPGRSTPDRVYLDAAEIAEMVRSGVQIGSHATSHAPLIGLTDKQLSDEISANKDYLEALAGRPVQHMALPYGKKHHYDRRALDRCFASGHRFVYSTNPCLFEARDVERYSQDPIPRIGLTNQSKQELLFLLNRPMFRSIDI